MKGHQPYTNPLGPDPRARPSHQVPVPTEEVPTELVATATQSRRMGCRGGLADESVVRRFCFTRDMHTDTCFVRMRTHACVCTYACTYIQLCMCVCIYIYMYISVHLYVYITYVYMYMYVYIYIYIAVDARICMQPQKHMYRLSNPV